MTLTGKILDMSINFISGKPKITFEVNEKENAMLMYDNLHEAEKLSIKVDKYRQKRSLNANNYAWLLMTQIAENQGITKEEVYRHHIKEIGVYRQVEINEKAVDTLIHSWQLHGLGWFAEKVDYGLHDEFVLVNLYYGSSTYNTKQMARLIDNIIQDCENLGIEHRTPDEIANMLSLWEGAKQ